jgi:hypothetical protein
MHTPQVIVEGSDDMHFVHQLSNYANFVRGSFETKKIDGYTLLLDSLDTVLIGSELQLLGVMVDADHDVAAKWASLKNRLESLGYSLPNAPSSEGIIASLPNKPTVGIWIMPDNIKPGTLEDFIAELIPSTDNLWENARQCVANIPPEQRRFKPSYEMKACVHTWLAWQEEPGTPLGQAVTKRYLDAEKSQAQVFVAWLKQLFML